MEPACESWIGIDDVTGEGQQTFEHECGEPKGHEGKHKCMGHRECWADDGWDSCSMEW